MLGRRIPFGLAVLSLLVIGIYGLRPKDHNMRCPTGTPASSGCNPRTYPSACPSGYHCHNPTDGSGLCCPDNAKVTCPSGGSPAGPCGPFDNQCPSGHFCVSPPVDGPGTCCSLDMQMVLPNCRNGGIPTGRCLHSVTSQCTRGYFCQDVLGDRMGVCCPTRIVRSPLDSCPVSDRVGLCVFLPGINCLSDAECLPGQQCCPDGCGKVCKYVGGGSYFPGPAFI